MLTPRRSTEIHVLGASGCLVMTRDVFKFFENSLFRCEGLIRVTWRGSTRNSALETLTPIQSLTRHRWPLPFGAALRQQAPFFVG